MQARTFSGRLAQAIHAYPTMSMGVQQAVGLLFPGGRATIIYALAGSAVMAAYALVDPFLRTHGSLPIEWLITLTWSILGIVFWSGGRERRGDTHV